MLLRVITASILAPIFILLTLYLPTQWFSLVLLAILISGLYEWNQLTVNSNTLFVCTAIFLAVATGWFLIRSDLLLILCYIAAVFWLSRIYVLAYTDISNIRNQYVQYAWGCLVMLSTWAALVLIHQLQNGPIITLAVMMMVWAADSMAYFAGKSFGKHKLAPTISPKKSIEGLIGGLIGSIITAWIFAYLILKLPIDNIILWILAAIAAGLISVVGDLFESSLKRRAGVKDSGKILPGHGGILDRIDGLVAAAPMFVAIWKFAL